MDPAQPEPQKNERVPIKSLRTYQGDVEEAMAKNKYSATTILVAEQKRRIETPRVAEKHIDLEARNKLFTIVGITLFFFGVLTVVAVYYVRSHEQVVIEQETKTILDFNVERVLPISSATKDSFGGAIAAENKAFKLPVNSVLFINTVDAGNNPESIMKLTSLIGQNMPSSLVRSFGQKYMVGIISFDTNEPFIILTTEDYPSAYAGMLKWEKDMVTDLGKIFSISRDMTDGIFVDLEQRNKDLRILKDTSGKSILIYSFINKNTLIITKNENVFNAVLARYVTSQNTR